MHPSSSHFEQFLAREQRRNQSAYERDVLDRWMQLLANQYRLYDVNNAHRCFDSAISTELTPPQRPGCAAHGDTTENRAIHRPTHVIRPFASVPQFFGCVQCGRSHHCWGERDSCEIVYSSENERVEVCRYSGRVIRNQDNLRATYEDTSRKRPSLRNYVANSYCPRSFADEPRSVDRTTRKKQHLIRRLSKKQWQRKKEKKKRRTRETLAQPDQYELSMESVSTSSGAEEEETGENESLSEEAEESSVTHESLEEEAKTLKRKRGDEDDSDADQSTESASCDDERASAEDTPTDDDGEGTGVATATGNADDDDGDGLRGEDSGTTGFAKNYHNNLQYNNERYAFLNGVIRKWARERDESQVYARELRESRRIEEAVAAVRYNEACAPDEPDRQFALKEQMRNKIYRECELLLRELLQCQAALAHLETCQQFYAPLLCNIAALVYASEKLSALTHTRTHKNQKQQKNTTQLLRLGLSTIDCASLDSLQSDAEYHEYTLEPQRLCRVLLHYLLLQPLSLRDAMGNRIDLWQRDTWLAQATQRLASVERDRREMQPTCELVRECLTSYARCPYWARTMIYWPEAV